MMQLGKINTVVQSQPTQNLPLPDSRVIWGRMLLNIKKSGNIMLHSICVGIGDVKVQNKVLYINVPGAINYETLKKPQNYAQLVASLQNLGYNLDIELSLGEVVGGIESKIAKIESILGCKISVS